MENNYSVSDQEFHALVNGYYINDGSVTLEQLREAAKGTRVPEVVLNAYKIPLADVLGPFTEPTTDNSSAPSTATGSELDNLSFAELKNKAAELGIDTKPLNSKKKCIEAINAHNAPK